ncbi:MAG: hypothetical protein M3088_05230, partial [Actinomycetota bacterium]|nr:hypothetical protein [Actinomycetota bacterium]
VRELGQRIKLGFRQGLGTSRTFSDTAGRRQLQRTPYEREGTEHGQQAVQRRRLCGRREGGQRPADLECRHRPCRGRVPEGNEGRDLLPLGASSDVDETFPRNPFPSASATSVWEAGRGAPVA